MDLPLVEFSENCSVQPGNTSHHINFYQYVTLAISPCNILANLFALHIFQQRAWRRVTMATLLKGLSILEVLFNSSLLLHILVEYFGLIKYFLLAGVTFASIAQTIVHVNDCIIIGSQMARNWAIVILAGFRYIMICHATSSASRPKVLINPSRLKHIYILLTLACISLSIPRLFEYRTKYCLYTGEFLSDEDVLSRFHWFRYGYLAFVMFLFQSGGPVILVCIFSTLVIRRIQIQKSFRRMRSTNGKGVVSETKSPGRLVFALCCAFTILEMPTFFSKLLQEVLIHRGAYELNFYLGVVANLCVYLDSTLNVGIYLASNQSFRTASQNSFLMKPIRTLRAIKRPQPIVIESSPIL